MDDSINIIFLKNIFNRVEVDYISAFKTIVWLVFDVAEISRISCVCKFVKVYYPVVGIIVDEPSYYVTSNEARSAGDKDVSFIMSHSSLCFNSFTHFANESTQYGIAMPNVDMNLDLSRTE